MELIATLTICLLISFLSVMLAKKLKISAVISLIIAGIVIGSPAVASILLEPNTEFVLSLGNIGLVVLMFLAGLEISWNKFCKEKKKAAEISFFAFVTPLLIGFAVFFLIGFSFITALLVGICMSITAEATNAEVLIEIKKLKTKVGSLIMGAGIIDDVLGIFLFISIALYFAQSIAASELMVLFIAVLSFFAGIGMHKLIGRESFLIQRMEKFLLYFIIPFFFIAMGIHFSFHSLMLNSFLLILIVAVAIAGKILGSVLTQPFTKLKTKQLYLIGWGMNSRGAVELAIAFTAFKIGLLSKDIYSGLVFMALFTTLIFPFFVRNMVKKQPRILE